MTCAVCHREIGPAERTARIYLGTICEICTDKADQCSPKEDDDAINA